jgi:DNA-binding NarL/FixJ family response regulator
MIVNRGSYPCERKFRRRLWGRDPPSSDDLPRPSGTEELSPRQLHALRLLVQGKSTHQIAADLHLAPETVRNYVGSLLKTLGARSRLEATLVALRDGVVSLDLD